MPTIRKRNTAFGAGGATVFPLQGSQYEYLPFPARVEFAIVGVDGTDTGATQVVEATVYSGSDILQQRGPITDKSDVTAQSKQAVYPDDFLLDDVAAAGERISVEINVPASTTGDNIVDTVVKITPL